MCEQIHPGLTEQEKKKLCRILDSQRFSVAACMHAAQNERLPLRIVVQVLFGEQLKLREAITGTCHSIDEDRVGTEGAFLARPPLMRDDSPDSVGNQQAMLNTTNQMEIRALQTELTTMRIKYTELEKNHAMMMDMVRNSHGLIPSFSNHFSSFSVHRSSFSDLLSTFSKSKKLLRVNPS